MIFFQSIRENFAIIGIHSHQSTQKCPFNARSVACLLIYILGLISSVAYLLYEARNFAEYSNAAYSISGGIVCGVTMATMVWIMPKLFQFFTCIENIASKSELNQTVEFVRHLRFSLFRFRVHDAGIKIDISGNQ